MNNYKITIQYDGTRYKGWQGQNSTGLTIQGKIEAVLGQMAGHAVEVIGSGRTDAALFIALTYVFTAFINIRLPITANGGLIHLGNVPLFICAIIFGKKSGAIAGGVGMGLFDLLSGWTAWAPFTLIIVACQILLPGKISTGLSGKLRQRKNRIFLRLSFFPMRRAYVYSVCISERMTMSLLR